MRKLHNNKKGIKLDNLPQFVMIMVLVGGLALGGFVTWQALSDAFPDDDANASTANVAQRFFNNVTAMIENIGAQLPTIGTIIGVGLLIGIVVIAFVVARSRGMF